MNQNSKKSIYLQLRKLRYTLNFWSEFNQWSFHTPWIMFAFRMMRANILVTGLIIILTGLILKTSTNLIPQINIISTILIVLSIPIMYLIGIIYSIHLWTPVMKFQFKHRTSGKKIEQHILSIPNKQTTAHVMLWSVESVLIIVFLSNKEFTLATLIGSLTFFGGIIVGVLSYQSAVRSLETIRSEILTASLISKIRFKVKERIILQWFLSSAVPIFMIILISIYIIFGVVKVKDYRYALLTVVFLGLFSILLGYLGTYRISRSISRPLIQLGRGFREVSLGNYPQLPVYDVSGIGRLQFGFNKMVENLEDQQKLSNLFGKYVGYDVAKRALETEGIIEGVEKNISLVFIDIVSSTKMSTQLPPKKVVELLNNFFEIIVETADKYNGLVNKFIGDAALIVFNAPLDQEDYCTQVLAMSRELLERIEKEIPEITIGMGISSGPVIAGNFGAKERFEYTVIGDAVNEASRLTDLAKDSPSPKVLASEQTIEQASRDEQTYWEKSDSKLLRGRKTNTIIYQAKNVVNNITELHQRKA